MTRIDIADEARNRWTGILTGLGMESKFLRNKHGPCPLCGGKDRWRYDDKNGNGTWFCEKCGSGVGMNLVMLLKGLNFNEAAKLVRGVLGTAKEIRPVTKLTMSAGDLQLLWDSGGPLKHGDSVDVYLRARGIELSVFPDALRSVGKLPYYGGARVLFYPAMLAAVTDGGKFVGVHRTYLDQGAKAPVDQPRKLAGKDGVIQMFANGGNKAGEPDTLGVAEGIETALSARQLLGGKMTVWSCISAHGMETFEWPISTERLVIFGDNDRSFTGQRAAYTLAFRAKHKGLDVMVDIAPLHGEDWNDYLQRQLQ